MAKLSFPKMPSEMDLAFRIGRALDRLGFIPKFEIGVKGVGRPDIVVFKKSKRALWIIEVKPFNGDTRKPDLESTELTRIAHQLDQYKEFGLPVHLVCGVKQATRYTRALTHVGYPNIPDWYTCPFWL